MGTINNPETLVAFRDKGCLLADETVDRDAMITVVAAELEANHVAESIDDVDDVAVDPGRLTVDLFGVDDADLTKLVRGLLSTGAGGKVQTALADGHTLCAAKTKVTVSLPGGELKSFSTATRFVTGDHDTIASYLLDPSAKRAVAAAKSVNKLGGIVKARQPGMAARVDEWTGQLQITFQTALTAGSGS